MVPMEAGHDIGEHVAPVVGFLVADRREDQQRTVAQPPYQMTGEQDGGAGGPMQVVDDEYDRTGRAEGLDPTDHGLEQPVLLGTGIGGGPHLRPDRQEARQPGKELNQRAGVRTSADASSSSGARPAKSDSAST